MNSMNSAIDKLGVFVAGGPAAGINAVIKGIVQEADNHGIRVLGYVDGAYGLVHDRFVHLTREMVEDIQFLGGSVIGTSRYRIDAEGRDVTRIVDNLCQEGVDALISIGGEGTLQLADHLRQRGIRIVHVPKTIDNDIAEVSQSFGFDTAVHEAARMLTNIKLDAQTSDLWFVVEIMGRYAGHLALEAGLAAGCTRVLIPEAGPIPVDELVTLIETRARCGQNWGVILAAESAHFGEGYVTHSGRLGGVGEQLTARLEAVCRKASYRPKIRASNLGYFLRCPQPTGYDRAYAVQLGLGAARFILEPACSGQMVTIVDDQLVGVPMERVAGKVKQVDLNGLRYQALLSMMHYESARVDLVERQQAWRNAASCLRWLDRNTDLDTVAEFAMRLNLPAETVLEVLQDMERADGAAPDTRCSPESA